MIKIAVFVANGSEEIEAITPVDILRRAGAECDIVSVSGKTIVGSHGINLNADKLIEQVNANDYDGVVIAGGMPGATNISNCEKAVDFIKALNLRGKLVSAICASPAVVLANHGLITGKATCYNSPQFVKLLGENYVESDVVTSSNVITANGPMSAFKFALEIVKYFNLNVKF